MVTQSKPVFFSEKARREWEKKPDIVERLRLYADTGARPSLHPSALREAADEIERLRHEVEMLGKTIRWYAENFVLKLADTPSLPSAGS